MENAFNKIDQYLSFFGKDSFVSRGNTDIISSGSSLILRERYEEAQKLISEAIKFDPRNPRLKELFAVACDGMGQHEKAIKVFTELIDEEPSNPDHCNNISIAFSAIKKKKEALYFAMKAVDINRNPVYLNNLGLQFKNLGMLDEAITSFQEALQYVPDPCFMVNLATAYGDKLDCERAIEYCEAAISIKPQLSGAHVNLAYYYHMVGRHKEAWAEYEHRIYHFKQIRDFLERFEPNKRWNGYDSLKGKRILVLCEQGLGDTIHFIRYVKLLKELDCHVIVFGPLQLAALCESCEGVDEYICKEINQGLNYDFFTLLLSLPYLLKCDDIPNQPYIPTPKASDLLFGPHKLKIGICWKGSKLHDLDYFRSINPALFFELSQIKGVQLVSLQKEDTTAELQSTKAISFMNEVNDFKDTAAIMGNLDLVISVDTSVLHLAGAMGREVWGLLPYRCDWRWGLEGKTTSWYPSMRLFRQKEKGNWADIFGEVKADINRKLSAT